MRDTAWLGIYAGDHNDLTNEEWEEVGAAIEEMLSKHPKFHTTEFSVDYMEEED